MYQQHRGLQQKTIVFRQLITPKGSSQETEFQKEEDEAEGVGPHKQMVLAESTEQSHDRVKFIAKRHTHLIVVLLLPVQIHPYNTHVVLLREGGLCITSRRRRNLVIISVVCGVINSTVPVNYSSSSSSSE